MRAGIVTFSDGTNYGQRLQNLAVQEILEKEQYEVYTFRLRRPDYGLVSMLKRTIKAVVKIKGSVCCERRKRRFKSFNKKYIHFYQNEIYSEMDASKINQQFDLVVVGSDQVWNPYSAWVTDVNFLQFVNPSKRMALAASFAVDEIPDNKREKYFQYINDIRFITVREHKGTEIIRQLCQREVPVVLDPTLMVSKTFWKRVARKPKRELPENYVVMYFLGEIMCEKDIEEWARETRQEIIKFDKTSPWYVTAPDEFIYIVQHANFVFTDSYHGTIFSILFHVEFRNFLRKDHDFSMQSRFETLYQLLGIKPEDALSIDLRNKKMNYESIDLKLQEAVDNSMRIINSYIQEMKEHISENKEDNRKK